MSACAPAAWLLPAAVHTPLNPLNAYCMRYGRPRRHAGSDAGGTEPVCVAPSAGSDEESFVLVDSAGASDAPTAPKAAVAPVARLSVKQTLRAAAVVRSPGPARRCHGRSGGPCLTGGRRPAGGAPVVCGAAVLQLQPGGDHGDVQHHPGVHVVAVHVCAVVRAAARGVHGIQADGHPALHHRSACARAGQPPVGACLCLTAATVCSVYELMKVERSGARQQAGLSGSAASGLPRGPLRPGAAGGGRWARQARPW